MADKDGEERAADSARHASRVPKDRDNELSAQQSGQFIIHTKEAVMTTEPCSRRSHCLPIAITILMSILSSLPAWAQQYYVSIGGGTSAIAAHGIPSSQSVSPSNL